MLEEQGIVPMVPRAFLGSPHRQQLHSYPKTLTCGGAAEGDVSSIHISMECEQEARQTITLSKY